MNADLLSIAAQGMDVQRAALDVAARNVAAAEAAGPKGSYARLVPRFHLLQRAGNTEIAFAGAATERGSHVDILTEMVSVLRASRAFEANASVFDLAKRLAERTIEVERAVRVVPLQPDMPQPAVQQTGSTVNAFTDAVSAIAGSLARAESAENAYALGTGTLQSAVLERARADVALAVAAAATQRTATAVQSILNLQI